MNHEGIIVQQRGRNQPYAAFIVLLLGLYLCQDAVAQFPPHDLEQGWNKVTPNGEAICSNGTDYAFFVRPADPEKLLIYFQPGGGCWKGENCDLTMQPTYDPVVREDDNPAENPHGIFDLNHPENPFVDYSMVFVSYCTADAHLGDTVRTYVVPATDSTESHEVMIYHKGYDNTRTVLDWTFNSFDSPDTVFVTGSSAGAMSSAFYASIVADAYPDAHIAHLGDGLGGFRSHTTPPVLAGWSAGRALNDTPGFDDVSRDSLMFETYFIASMKRHPEIIFSQFNTAEDAVQRQFLAMLGDKQASLNDLLKGNYADIETAGENFRSFTAGGDLHMILNRPEFYSYQADGIRFRDWVAELATGKDVPSVTCRDCQESAQYGGK